MSKVDEINPVLDKDIPESLNEQRFPLLKQEKEDTTATKLDPNLKRISGKIPPHALLIVLTEFCERFTFYGGSTVFYNYVFYSPPNSHTRKLIEDGLATLQPGALGKGQSAANALSYYFTFFCYLTPIIGAIFADQYWGKYRTILSFSFIYLAGLLLLTISSAPSGFSDDGTPIFGSFAFIGYILAITIIGLGTGGIKSVVSPMCADQINSESYVTEVKGEKVIIDSEKTVQHLYNWFYWAINIGALAGQIICTTLERTAFWLAYLIPTCVFTVSIAIFTLGKNKYVHVPPEGSAFIKSFKCLVYANKRKKKYKDLYPVSSKLSFSFLEYSKPLDDEPESEAAERTWSNEFPDELRQTLKACSIFPLLSIYWVCYAQMTTNLISQASQMKRPHWMSNDVVNVIDPLVLVLLIPLFDSFVYPLLAKHNIKFTYIKRIALGFLLAAASMGYAAIVQSMIYSAGPNYSNPDPSNPNDVNIWIQFPAYILIATSEIFTSIGSLEYSYTHAPKSMKCLVSSLALLPNAAAALIGIFLAPAAKDPQMTWMYGGTAIVAGLSTLFFFFSFKKYDEQEEEETGKLLLEE